MNKLRVIFFKKLKYVRMGDDCYIGPNFTITPFGGKYYRSPKPLLFLGDRVTISPNVTLLCSMHPEKSKLSKLYGKMAPIIIESDAWIGAGAIILAGISIGEASIVGAGAVVTKNVDAYTIVAGVPAKKIKIINKEDLM